MRQLVALAAAVQKRRARDWYDQLTSRVVVRGGKLTKSFEEVFPQYGNPQDSAIAVDEDAAMIMDKLAEKHLAELKRKFHGRTE